MVRVNKVKGWTIVKDPEIDVPKGEKDIYYVILTKKGKMQLAIWSNGFWATSGWTINFSHKEILAFKEINVPKEILEMMKESKKIYIF